MKVSQQQLRIFHKRLEHKEDEIILMDKAEWKNLDPKNTYKKRTGLRRRCPFQQSPGESPKSEPQLQRTRACCGVIN